MTKHTLISFPLCPFVQRAIIAMKEKQAEFEVVYIDLADKPDWFTAISPLGKVPVLKVERDGEEPAYIFESAVILEFIEETVPDPKLYASDPLARARQRSWVEFGTQLLSDLWGYTSADSADAVDAAAKRIRDKFSFLEAEVVGPYFSGDSFSYVDAAFGPIFRQIDTIETVTPTGLVDDYPNLMAWRSRLAIRPSIQAAVPADYVERYIGFLRTRRAFVLSEK